MPPPKCVRPLGFCCPLIDSLVQPGLTPESDCESMSLEKSPRPRRGYSANPQNSAVSRARSANARSLHWGGLFAQAPDRGCFLLRDRAGGFLALVRTL